jgi:senataxin
MWNFYGSRMHRSPLGGISNSGEASFVVELLQAFANQNAQIRNLNIGIISFYNEQVADIKKKVNNSHLDRWMYSNRISLQISTVDGFQGSEKDIIILSCVRSRWINDKKPRDVGFLKDFRRVNVALTRAKYSLWIVSDCKTLSKDPLWSSLIDDAYDRKLIAQYQNLESMVINSHIAEKRHTTHKKIKK